MNKPDIELPPLPSPLGIVDPEGTEGMVQYTASDLANYAKAYAMDAIAPYKQRIAEMEAELEAIGAGGVSGQRITGGRQRGGPSDDDSFTIAYMSGYHDGKRTSTPEGWKLVPIEPNSPMEAAAEDYWNGLRYSAFSKSPRTWAGAYGSMLKAAPKFGEEG